MKKSKILNVCLTAALTLTMLAGCGNSAQSQSGSEISAAEDTGTTGQTAAESTDGSDLDGEINVFVAASLSDVMDEVASVFNETYPNVEILFNADSSGTLMTQIEEGFACDIFFSAAQTQMNELEEKGFIVDGTRKDVVNNQVCVITYRGSDTAVTGLLDIKNAKSIALADGSVPVGRYTRQAMINAKMLPETDDPASITTQEISDALGGVEISEQGNVSKVRTAVIEGSCEVGTVYYSDTYGFEDDLDILERVSYDLTGNVIYPVCRIQNDQADETVNEAADAFYEFIISDEAKEIFDKYLFDTNV